MSDRERWIVYPLLFFAMSLAARSACNLREMQRDEYQQKAGVTPAEDGRFHKVTCRQLEILSPDGKLRTRLGDGTNQAGQIQLIGPDGRSILLQMGANGRGEFGLLQTNDDQGRPLVTLSSSNQGGVITMSQRTGNRRISLGYGSEHTPAGLFVTEAQRILGLFVPRLMPQQPPAPQSPTPPVRKEPVEEKEES